MVSARRRITAVVLSTVAAFLALAILPSVSSAADGGATLAVRQIDARKADAVGVTFLYTGDPADLQNMSLRENGVAKEVELNPLAKSGQRMANVLVVDTSGSMNRDGMLTATTKAANGLVGDLGAGDSMAVLSFNDSVTVETDFTTDTGQLRTAVEGIASPRDGHRALFAAIHRAGLLITDQKRLQAGSDIQGNIIVVSDGHDDASENVGQREVAAVLRSSGAALFTINLTHAGGTDAKALGQLAARAGGMIVDAADAKAVPEAFDRVERALSNQYVATYKSTAGQGAVEISLGIGSLSTKASFVSGSQTVGAAAEYVKASGGGIGPSWLHGSAGIALIVVFTALAIGGIVYAFASLATTTDESLTAMLRPYEEGKLGGDDDEDRGLAQTAILQRAVELTEGFAERQGFLVKVEALLERADLPLRAAEAMFFYAIGIVVFGLGAMFLLGFGPGLLAILVLALLPPAALSFLAGRRAKKFVSLLPDTLHLLSGSLRAGYSLMQGVEAVSQEVEEPMGKELRRVITEARLGREVEDSLDAVAERMQSADFAWAVMAIRIQREVGGNLAELLNTVAETMIQRERLRREVAALTAEGKISAIILGILPVGLGILMWVINPEYMKPLGTTGLGQALLGLAIVSALIGFAWMKKTITIDM